MVLIYEAISNCKLNWIFVCEPAVTNHLQASDRWGHLVAYLYQAITAVGLPLGTWIQSTLTYLCIGMVLYWFRKVSVNKTRPLSIFIWFANVCQLSADRCLEGKVLPKQWPPLEANLFIVQLSRVRKTYPYFRVCAGQEKFFSSSQAIPCVVCSFIKIGFRC